MLSTNALLLRVVRKCPTRTSIHTGPMPVHSRCPRSSSSHPHRARWSTCPSARGPRCWSSVGQTSGTTWFLAFLVVLALESVAAVYFYPLPPLVVALGVAVLVFVLARLLWVYDDWRIDIYMLTDRAVIDVERKPFYLSERRQQASLDNLQDVSYTIRSPLARMLGYGDVVMETAGTSGKQTWSYVPDPRGVQNEIISRMEASRQAKLASERKSREAEIKEWIGEYHKLQQGGPQPPPSGNAP